MPESDEQRFQQIVQQLLDDGMAPQDLLAAFNQEIRAAVPSPFAIAKNTEIALPAPPSTAEVLRVRIDLVGAKPPIWRRLDVRGDVTLDHLHHLLQAAMGWTDSHLHRFTPHPTARGRDPWFVTEFDRDEGEEGTPEESARLDQVLRAKGDVLSYEYDFGDGWEHRIVLESSRVANTDHPVMTCVAGRRLCPPEDVGGIGTWNELSEALRRNPDPTKLTGDLQHYSQWLPRTIQPDLFSVEATNQMIQLVDLSPSEQVDRLSALGLLPVTVAPLDEIATLLPDHRLQDFGDWIIQAWDQAGLSPNPVPPPTDEELEWLLQPWLLMIELAHPDGIRLTQAGFMAPEVCLEITANSRIDNWYGQGNRESNSQELALHRRLAIDAGLLRKHKGRLVLTRPGKKARTDREELIRCASASLLGGRDEFTKHAWTLAVLLLAATGTMQPDVVADMLTEIGWTVDGQPVKQRSARLHPLDLALGCGSTAHRHNGPAVSPAAVRYLAARALFRGP